MIQGANINRNVKWLDKIETLVIEEKIRDSSQLVRCICGIFIRSKSEEYVYVGRTTSIYERLFGSKGHITYLKKGIHFNEKLNTAVKNNQEIEIRILETVPYIFDNYYKDIQRLASAENRWIDKFQSINQCLEQVPEGKMLSKELWFKMSQEENK